jgi:hypothetical protein
VSQKVEAGDLEQAVSRIFPLVSPTKTKYLLVEFGSEWVVVVDNGIQGTDASLAPVLSGKASCLGVRVLSRPHTYDRKTGKGAYGAEIFESFRNGNAERIIFCANDGGKWTFGQSGSPYPVENVRNYSSHIVSARFGRPDLSRILDHLGINLLGPNSSRSAGTVRALLCSREGQLPLNYREHKTAEE